MSGEVDPVSHKLGKLEGVVSTLVDQQSAVFRKIGETNDKIGETNDKIDKLANTFAAFSQQAPDTGGRLTSLEISRVRHEEALEQRKRQRIYWFASVPLLGVAINQIIEFFKGSGQS